MDCTYLLNEKCKNACGKYGIGMRACSLKMSIEDMESIISKNLKPTNTVNELKPYIMSIHDLAELGKREPYWDRNIESAFAKLIEGVTGNELLSIASVSVSKKNNHKDTRNKTVKEIEKLRNKIEQALPHLDYYIEMQF